MVVMPLAALLLAAYVYVRKGGTIAPLSPLYTGPYRVLSSGLKAFRLRGGKQEEVVFIDRLKSHKGATPVQPARPTSRGQPSAS